MNDILSLLFYLTSFALSFFFVHLGEKRKSRCLTWVGILIPTIIGGLRYQVGTDYGAYTLAYNDALRGSTYLGSAFSFFSSISNTLTGDNYLMFSIYALLTVSFFLFALKRYNMPSRPVAFLLFLLTLYPQTFNMVRQGAAISIFFYATSYIRAGKLKRYLAFSLLAGWIHTSAFVLLPMYFIVKMVDRITQKHRLLIVAALCMAVIVLAAVAASLDMLPSYIAARQTAAYSSADPYTTVFYLGVTIVLFLFYKYLNQKYEDSVMFYEYIIIGVSLLLLGFVLQSDRMGLYFLMPSFIVLLNRTLGIGDDVMSSRFFLCANIVFGILYFIAYYYILGKTSIFPYQLKALG